MLRIKGVGVGRDPLRPIKAYRVRSLTQGPSKFQAGTDPNQLLASTDPAASGDRGPSETSSAP